jgi:septum formation protein
MTAVAVLAPDGREASRVVESRVTFKRLSLTETEGYIASGEWQGKAGGYAIQGIAGGFVTTCVRLIFRHRRPAALRDCLTA